MLALVLNLFFLLVEGTEWAEVAGAHLDEPIRTFLLHRVGAWLAGDLVGILLIFPFVFLLEQIYWRSRMGGALLVPGGERGWRGRVILLAEALVYLLAIVALVRFVLLSPWGWHFNLLFLAFLLVVPVSIRHGFFGAVLVAVAIDITGLAVIGFSEVRFVMQENSAVFHVFQLFVMALIITGMFLGAAFDQIRLARAELLQAKTAAEEASRAKTRFLQNVGHELRTPLNAILGFAQMMRDEVLGPVGVPRYRDYLDDILAAGRHLLGLVDRLLAVAAEDGSEESPELVPLDPAEIARRAVEMITPHAENADARLLLEAPGALPKVLGEEGRLLQVLLNLLDNAIKHGPRGGTVRLIVVAKEEAGEDLREGAPFLQASGRFVRFAVEDEGEGIPAEEREEVFERFVRRNVGEIAGAASGMGLGLHIVRTLVEQMGGRIRIEEADTGGARFLVDLPVSGRFAG
ncbi:MAG: hypothetical protein D6757_03760 [Alphaproteobacteria bacterium]|nr:MAG: hypothetical protein D6757_03760 [Alphaproteobacteria bacterium]